MDIMEQVIAAIHMEARLCFALIDKEQLRVNAPEWIAVLNQWETPGGVMPAFDKFIGGKSEAYIREFRYRFYVLYTDFIRSLPLSDRRRLADHWAKWLKGSDTGISRLSSTLGGTTGEEAIEYMLDEYHRQQTREWVEKKVAESRVYYEKRLLPVPDDYIAKQRADMIKNHFYSSDPSELNETGL